MIRRYSPGPLLTLPVPVQMLSAVLSRTFHSRIPRLDLKTWGEIFGVLNLDSAYDPFDTFRLLDIDPARYTLEKTLLPLVQQALQK